MAAQRTAADANVANILRRLSATTATPNTATTNANAPAAVGNSSVPYYFDEARYTSRLRAEQRNMSGSMMMTDTGDSMPDNGGVRGKGPGIRDLFNGGDAAENGGTALSAPGRYPQASILGSFVPARSAVKSSSSLTNVSSTAASSSHTADHDARMSASSGSSASGHALPGRVLWNGAGGPAPESNQVVVGTAANGYPPEDSAPRSGPVIDAGKHSTQRQPSFLQRRQIILQSKGEIAS